MNHFSFHLPHSAFHVPRLSGRALTLLLMLAIGGSAWSQPPVPGPAKVEPPAVARVLTLDDFIQRAAERDTEFEEILVERLFLAYRKGLLLPPGDLILDVRADYDFFPSAGEREPNLSVGLNKLFPFTGTEVDARYDVSPTDGGAGRASAAAFSITQPIAENAFGRSTRLLDKIVGIENDVARYQIIEAYEDYLATVITAYLDWYSAAENLKIARAAHEQNLALLDNIRARQRSQIALPVDVNKVTLQVMEKEEQLIEATERHKSALNVVERMIREELGAAAAPALPEIEAMPDDFLESWYARFREDSRTYAVLNMLEKRSALDVEREANQLLPSIALRAGYETDGEDAGLENREDRIFGGVGLAWPLPGWRDRAEMETARIERQRTEIETENVRYRLYTALRNLAIQIESERALIGIAAEKIQLAADILDDEAENYSFGRITLNDYIRAVNALDANRFNQTLHEVRLRELLTEFRRLTDVLVAESDIKQPAP